MGNELKLSLENFQSISHGELIFHTGTNVIIGQSNSGKTATFRALKACLINPAGSQRFIKKGTNKASVALEYNGNQIIWKRTPKESSYTINGEDFIKTGKSNAFKIMEDTGFVLDNDVIMNIEEELQLPFPFGIPKSELFKLYENVFCVSDSAVILKTAKDQEEDTKNKISMTENEIIKNKNKLSEIVYFKEEVNIEFLKEKKEYFQNNLKKVNYLKDGLPLIHKAAKVEDFKVEEISFTNKVINFSELKQLKRKLFELKQLHTLGKELKELKIPKVIDLTNLNELKELKSTCEKLSKIKELKIDEKSFEGKVEEYNKLKNYASTLKSIKNKIKERREALEEIEDNIQSIEEKLKKFKVCPLCHKPLD